jgi:nicotinamidase-related amidase
MGEGLMNDDIRVRLRQQELGQDENGYIRWKANETERSLPPRETALLLCDVWDSHHCRGAVERLEAMIPQMSEVVNAARQRGVQIIHAPSDTMKFYADHPARLRMQGIRHIAPPPPLDHVDPPLPIDDSDGGQDTGETTWYEAWTRQHPGITIDPERDAISDNGEEVYSLLQQQGIKTLLIMGVHTNMCVLGRSFAIKPMARWGVDVALVRDLTDTMYNPALRPYVSHEEGTRLVVEFIEKFWCPTLLSSDLMT